jgi:pilus assembly protein CpaF
MSIASAPPVVADAALVADLDAQVRAAVRRDGVDPQREVHLVRSIAEQVVRAHDERSLTGAVTPVPDATRIVGELVARVSGFGALQGYLDDPDVEEIWINDPSRVFVARGGRHELTNTILTKDEVLELVERMLKQSGRRLDLSSPFVDARLPEGHRLHVVLEGISSDFSAVNIRKFVVRASRLTELVELGSLTDQAARFLDAAVRAGLNLIVAGGTQAGKTTMLNCLAAAIPGGDRIVSAEEVRELQVVHPDWVALETRQAGLEGNGEVTLRDLVRESLRMRPTRIVVGEVRSAEALDLLLALNSGLPGMATLHANSAREALVKLCTLPMLAGANNLKGEGFRIQCWCGRTGHHLWSGVAGPQGARDQCGFTDRGVSDMGRLRGNRRGLCRARRQPQRECDGQAHSRGVSGGAPARPRRCW